MTRLQRLLLVPVLALSMTVGVLAQGTVKITNITTPVRPGTDATVTAQVPAKAQCTVVVHYKRGPSQAKGLEPKTADANGVVSWTWRISTRLPAGPYTVTVTANPGGTTTGQFLCAGKPDVSPSAAPAP